jgi:hypothetical protein
LNIKRIITNSIGIKYQMSSLNAVITSFSKNMRNKKLVNKRRVNSKHKVNHKIISRKPVSKQNDKKNSNTDVQKMKFHIDQELVDSIINKQSNESFIEKQADETIKGSAKTFIEKQLDETAQESNGTNIEKQLDETAQESNGTNIEKQLIVPIIDKQLDETDINKQMVETISTPHNYINLCPGIIVPFSKYNEVEWIEANALYYRINYSAMEARLGEIYTRNLLYTLISDEEARYYYNIKGVLDDITNYLEL